MLGVIGGKNEHQGAEVRQRMVRSAARLFGERGFAGAGLRDVVAHSAAPRGSIYHHFPGGKAQLAQEAVDLAADAATVPLTKAPDPVAALHACLDDWRRRLEDSDFQAGSTLASAAIEGALVLCRARRDTAPLDDVERELEVAIAGARRR